MKKQYGLLVLMLFASFWQVALAIKLKPGLWHTEFQLRASVNLPVIFAYENTKPGVLVIINGDERIRLTDVRTSQDSLYVMFPAFDSELKIKVHSKTYISGAWFNRAKSPDYNIHFWSKLNGQPRFRSTDIYKKTDGRWEVTFDYKEKPEKAVGIFKYPDAAGNLLHGTFLTESGDYRFLEGASIGDSLYLSCFDGSHAFLFRAKLSQDTLWGDFHSGSHYRTDWYAVRNQSFELRHPDSITYVVDESPLKFDLMKLDGSFYHYPNKTLTDKVVLIQIMGTWCSNCLDESNYLKTIRKTYEDQVEVLAVTFETQVGTQGKIDQVLKYQQALDLDFTFLIGGDACKSCAAEIFPKLNDIVSFPTLIVVDKKGEIRKIHTGFSGPGTGKYYTDFVTETNAFIDQLIKE
jgi:thiol-disulfide isomerase/thioredoxin